MASTAVDRNGAHSRTRPISSSTMPSSAMVNPEPAQLLGNGEALQTELLRHLRPHRRVVALVGLHEPADLRLGRLLLEERPHRAPQLLLLVGQGEVHASPLMGATSPC